MSFLCGLNAREIGVVDDVAVMAVFDEVVFHFLMGQFATEGINPPVLGSATWNYLRR